MRTFVWLCCLLVCTGFSGFAQTPGGIMGPNTYAKTVRSCFRAFYVPPEPLDSMRAVDPALAHRIWRIIDFKNTANYFLLRNDPNNCLFDLWEVLKLGVRSGAVHAFKSDQFMKPVNHQLSKAEAAKLLRINDTITENVFGADGNSTTQKRVIDEEISSGQLSGFIICEDWYFDKYWAKTDKRIICICPVYFDQTTQAEKPLFWLYYNECRQLLASYQVPLADLKNPISYDQLFLKRKFAFYLTKESNVMDRKLSEYRHGDARGTQGQDILSKLLSEDFDKFDH